MKKFARSGRIIAALVLGTSLTITASPAAFAKKKKTQTPDFTLSVAFRSAAREIQTALDTGDTATANARIESLGGLAQTPAEKYTAAALRMQLAGKRSEEHTSELQSLMRNSYAVFCLTKKKKTISVKYTTL